MSANTSTQPFDITVDKEDQSLIKGLLDAVVTYHKLVNVDKGIINSRQAVLAYYQENNRSLLIPIVCYTLGNHLAYLWLYVHVVEVQIPHSFTRCIEI